jgi:hypothetical protein
VNERKRYMEIYQMDEETMRDEFGFKPMSDQKKAKRKAER